MYPTYDMHPIAIRKMQEEHIAACERARPIRLPSLRSLTFVIALGAPLVIFLT